MLVLFSFKKVLHEKPSFIQEKVYSSTKMTG